MIIILFKEVISERIIDLCNKNSITPNRLSELFTIPQTTLLSMLANRVDNPSSTNIYKICKTFKISLQEFFDSELFNFKNIDD